MYKLTCMDVSFDEQRVYVGGRAIVSGGMGEAIVVALDFDNTLREISAKILNNLAYGTPHRLKRVKGTEQMIVGCDRHIAILEFDGRNMMQIASLANIHDNEITDFVLRGSYLYSTAFNEPLIKATKFDPAAGVTVSPLPLAGTGYTNFQVKNTGLLSNIQTTKNPHPALTGLEKVVATPSGNTVYTGGKGLHVFQKAG